MIDLGRPFRSPYHPARAWLLHKGFLGLLAFDAWNGMLEHAGRYGAGDFNVAHFAFLDALLPLPSPALYGGIIMLVGLLSFAMLLGGAPRAGKALLAALYTGSWLISLHDSYQHHYFLSYGLTWLVFVPDVSLADAARRDGEPVRGVGLSLTALTCAIVYAFTGVAKSEADWRSGAVLKRLSHSRPPGHDDPGVLDPVRDALMGLGLDLDTAWYLIALSVIALQWMVALGYVASLERDERPSRAKSWLTAAALAGAWSFHAFAEIGHMFDIGVFSYYMLWLALVLLSPASWLEAVMQPLFEGLSRVPERITTFFAAPPPRLGYASLLVAGVALAAAGLWLDIPGAPGACLLAALCLGGHALFLPSPGQDSRLVRMGVASIASALAMFVAIAGTHARFDYYRRAAGEFAKMQQLDTALALYLKAEAYAPRGESRRNKIEEIRSKLAQRNGQKPGR